MSKYSTLGSLPGRSLSLLDNGHCRAPSFILYRGGLQYGLVHQGLHETISSAIGGGSVLLREGVALRHLASATRRDRRVVYVISGRWNQVLAPRLRARLEARHRILCLAPHQGRALCALQRPETPELPPGVMDEGFLLLLHLPAGDNNNKRSVSKDNQVY